jgi:hypothetical protein
MYEIAVKRSAARSRAEQNGDDAEEAKGAAAGAINKKNISDTAAGIAS